jgi:hypothetical protein
MSIRLRDQLRKCETILTLPLRHFLARLRRRTWCVSKRRQGLRAHLRIAALWSNYVRGITNRSRTTAAQAVGLVRRAYRPEEVLAWRQDWGRRSPALAC